LRRALQISDGKTDYKLYGPASTMWSSAFDKAMMLFLSCTDCFAKFMHEKARCDGKPLSPETDVYNEIDVEKGTVAGYSIRYSGMTGSPDVWNKALKCLLVNLKVLLCWVTRDKGVVDAGSASVPPQMSVSEAGASGRGRGFAQSLTQSMRASMFPTRAAGEQRSPQQFGMQSMFQM
jgi:Apg6 BARA domain